MKNRLGQYIRGHVFTLEELSELPKSRREAITKGEKFYFNGNLCSQNHISPRRIDSKCRQCVNERDNERYNKIAKKNNRRKIRDIEQLITKTKLISRNEAQRNKEKYYLSFCNDCRKEDQLFEVKAVIRCILCERKKSKIYARSKYIPKERNIKQSKPSYNSLENILFLAAKKRAKRRKQDFNIELSDIYIPDRCPIFDTKIEKFLVDQSQSHKSRANSPSIDRVNPEKGYVKGNVCVISYRANVIKGQGTSTEHRLIAKWIKQNIGKN